MAALEFTHPQEFRLVSRLLQVAETFFADLKERKALRATRRELSALSDRELDDLGLNRADIADLR